MAITITGTPQEAEDYVIDVSNSYELACNIPAHSNGDLLVAHVFSGWNIGFGNEGPAITTPSGLTWTNRGTVVSNGNGGTGPRITVFTATGDGVAASESFAITTASTQWSGNAVISAWTGADTSNPMDQTVQTSVDNSAGSTTHTVPSITTQTNGAMVIWAWAADDDSATEGVGATDWDDDAGFQGTKLHFFAGLAGGGTNGQSTATCYQEQTTAGASGTCVFTNDSDAEQHCGITIALKPAVGGVSITDVNTTESWIDGESGLIITGTNFVQ